MTDLDKAREEYKDWKRRGDETGGTQQEADEWPYVAVKYADVLIAALEAEVEALKCCGNCGHWSDFNLCSEGNHDNFMGNDHCHFTPSHWQRRES